MNLKNSLSALFGLVLLFSCRESAPAVDREMVLEVKHLISHDSPMLHSGDPAIVLVDFRKAEAYEMAHLPGAVQFYRNDFQDSTKPYSGVRADRPQTAERLGKAGITDRHTIVVYDDKGSPDAARFWWLMKLYNFDKVYLLDGGIGHWQAMGGQTVRETPEIKPASFHFPELPDKALLIEKEDLLKLITSGQSNAIILDARSAEEYGGTLLKEGAKKAGRIPKSIHIDWAETVDYGRSNIFKPQDQLERIYARLDASKEDTIVVYCHSGVRSSHTTFVLTQLLDYKHVMNYDGSWVEWSYDDSLPFEKDSTLPQKK
jgi:thiosulfate/3-mercaptopyruvate sulfurtransferase